MKKIHIIINPASGVKEPILPALNEAIDKERFDWNVSVTKHPGDATALAKDAVKQDVDIVAVYGGDGTVMEVVSGMIGSKVPLAVLPGGSGNVMSTELGIPWNLQEACKLMCDGPSEVRAVDVGQVNDRYFILRTSLGFEAEIVKGANREIKNRFGLLAYWIAGLSALQRIRSVLYDITVDGQRYMARGVTCVVANSGNLGLRGLSIVNGVSISDGLLDVVVVKNANVSFWMYILKGILRRGTPRNVELVNHWQGRRVSVAARSRQIIQCDGELMKGVPLNAKVIPAAVNIIVPAKPKA